MLGLGLGVSKVSSLRSLAAKLLAKLKSRSTYYENNKDSKQVAKDLDTIEVLDKASILLTPTAYSDARVHSVKTYTGDDYVVGGDFSGFSTDWTTNTATESGGVVTIPDGGYIFQNISFPNDGTVRIRVEGSGTVLYRLGTTSPSSTFITKTLPFTAYEDLNSTDVRMQLNNTSGSDITVTSISVLDVSSDFDFDRASSATRINSDGLVQDMQSITDPELVLNGDFEELGDDAVTNGTFDTDSGWFKSSQSTISNGTARILSTDGSYQYISQTKIEYTNTQSKYVKITLDIVNYVSGTLKAQFSGGTSYSFPTSVGTHTIHVLNDGSSGTFNLARVAGVTDITIDNVSVQQVDPNARWIAVGGTTADNYVEFTEGFARLKFLNSSPITTLRSTTASLVSGRTYKLIVDVHDATSGAIKIDGGGVIEVFAVEGVTTRYITPNSNTTLSFYRATANVDITLASVSVEDITFGEDVDLARINYDSNGENGHWLLEPTSTNLVTYSEDFSQSVWEYSGDLSLESGYTAPDGSNTAYKVTSTNSALAANLSATNTQARSIWARTVSGTGTIQLLTHNSNTNNTFTITSQWQRFELNSTTSDTGVPFFYALDFRGAGTTLDEVIIWGGQLEALSYATSYIPTYGSTVTRATETLTGSGNSTLINSTEGVLYAEIASLVELDASNKHISISNGSDSNRLYFYYDTNGRFGFAAFVNGVLQANITYSGIIVENSKVACKYKENDFALWINGVEVGTDTSANVWSSGTFDRVNFAGTSASNNPFYGKVKALAVFDEALTDTELQNLTS